MTFANRIVDYGVKPADQFTANPKNARIHPQFQRDVMKDALNTIGFIAPVIENARTGYLIDGHERIMQALADNAPVPFVSVDMSEDEEAYALATFDPITSLAAYDRAQLDALLQGVQSDSEHVQRMLAELAIEAKVVPPNDPYAEWRGMPEFEHDDLTAYQSIHVHFQNAEDVQAFAKLIGQLLTDRTRAIWYPQVEIIRYGKVNES